MERIPAASGGQGATERPLERVVTPPHVIVTLTLALTVPPSLCHAWRTISWEMVMTLIYTQGYNRRGFSML